MKAIHWIIAAAAFACAEPVQAGINDPEVLIYRGAGVLDTGGAAFTGDATAFHCTNFSGTLENIRFVIRNADGTLMANSAFLVAHLSTITALTKDTSIFTVSFKLLLNTGSVGIGTVAIAATSLNVTCTAMLVQANITTPAGIKLHMTRFNPIAGTQE